MQAGAQAPACPFQFSSRWPISSGGGLQSRRGGCDSRTGFHSSGIGVERHTPRLQRGVEGALPSCPSTERSLKVRRLPWEQEQAGALPAVLTISRDAGAGDGQDFTGLASVVRLHARVAFGLQALQRCSGLLSRRARGSTVATHHFEQVGRWESDQVSEARSRYLTLPLSHPHSFSHPW